MRSEINNNVVERFEIRSRTLLERDE